MILALDKGTEKGSIYTFGVPLYLDQDGIVGLGQSQILIGLLQNARFNVMTDLARI